MPLLKIVFLSQYLLIEMSQYCVRKCLVWQGPKIPSDSERISFIAFFRVGYEIPYPFIDAKISKSDSARALDVYRRFPNVSMNKVVLKYKDVNKFDEKFILRCKLDFV